MRLHPLLLLTACMWCTAPAWAGDEDSADKKLRTAEALTRNGALADAEKLLLSIENPTAKMLQTLGQVQVRLKKYDEALKTYERYVALEKIPGKRAAGETMVSELVTLMKTRFKIITTPPGATVYIDSKADGPKGKTPLSQYVTPGKHRLILEMEGFETINVNVSAVEQQELELPFVLIPLGCKLTVTSDPPSARVFIDGKGAGVTPIERQLRGGSYRVEAILHPGEPPVVRQVTCDEKDQKPLQVHLGLAQVGEPPAVQAPPEVAKGQQAPAAPR